MADDLLGTTCQACIDAHEARASEWHAELKARLRPSYEGDPGDEDETPPTRPGKALPPDDDAA